MLNNNLSLNIYINIVYINIGISIKSSIFSFCLFRLINRCNFTEKQDYLIFLTRSFDSNIHFSLEDCHIV